MAEQNTRSPLRHPTARLLAAMDACAGTAVAFHLPSVRTVASDEQVRGMFFMPEDADLDTIEAVAMAPGGPSFLMRDGRIQLHPDCPAARVYAPTLFEAHAPDFRWLENLGAFCIGIGRLEQMPPVTLALNFDNGVARGAAVFTSPPCGNALDLLAAIGVRRLGETPLPDGRLLVHLENRLAAHVDAATLSQYRRTMNCNLFFMSHGNTDMKEIREGLESASRVRIAAGRERLAHAVLDLSAEALGKGLSLQMRVSGASETQPYGDLVPLGFLGMALQRIVGHGGPNAEAAAQRLVQVQNHLQDHRNSGLWGYGRNCIPTSTDTALVCLSGLLPDFESLEKLRGPEGGFMPQMVTEEGEAFSMRRTPATRHWEEEDLPTTAFLEALRLDAGLEMHTDAQWFLDRAARWGGLYFVPPTLGLWALARIAARLACSGANGRQNADRNAVLLRETILNHLAALRTSEGGFCHFDPALHNGFAVLALEELGQLGRTTVAAQLRVLDAWEAPHGVETPFYSTLISMSTQSIVDDFLQNSRPEFSLPCGFRHQVSLYEDPSRLIVTAVAAAALHVMADPGEEEATTPFPGPQAGIPPANLLCLDSPEEQALHHVQPYGVPRNR